MDQPVTGVGQSNGYAGREVILNDERDPGRERLSSQRVWSGPIFAVDADHRDHSFGTGRSSDHGDHHSCGHVDAVRSGHYGDH